MVAVMAVAGTWEKAAATVVVPVKSARKRHLVLFLAQGVVSLLCAEEEEVVAEKEKAEEKEKEEIGVDLD